MIEAVWTRRSLLGLTSIATGLLGGCAASGARQWPRFAPVVEIRVSARYRGLERFAAQLETAAKPHMASALIDSINGTLVLRLFGDDPLPVFRAALPLARRHELPRGSWVSRFERPGVVAERVVL